MDWKDVAVSNYICYCKKVTKKEIIMAINDGARTLEAIKETTGACTGNKCRLLNPTGKCCCSDLEEMIDYYGPVADAFKR